MRTSFRRVAVVGAVGCGKTSLAVEIAELVDAPHVEIDALRYRPDWSRVPRDEFRDVVAARAGEDCWVIDGNDQDVQDITWLRAQQIVWIDFPLHLTLSRLLRRTVSRLLIREEFANAQRERLGRILGRDSILLWAVRSHGPRRRLYENLLEQSRYSHLKVVRLRSPAAVRVWLESFRGSPGEPVPRVDRTQEGESH